MESWKKWNPDYELRFLSEANLQDYVDMDLVQSLNPHISIQERANCIRMWLLEQYGGVWADATTYCTTPLEQWLPQDLEGSGFFAYSFQEADRPMGNWFMAADKGSYIVQAFNRRFIPFWQRKRPLRVVDDAFKSKIKALRAGRLFNRNPWLWNSWLMVGLFRRYHYFVFHYMFGQLISKDPEFKSLWERSAKRSSFDAHALLRHGLQNPLTPDLKAMIDDPEHKVFKLSWKDPVDPAQHDTVYAYLSQKLSEA